MKSHPRSKSTPEQERGSYEDQSATQKEREAGMRAVFSNLEDAYETGYADGMADMRRRYRRRQEKKARRWYYIKQKLYGVAVLIATVFTVWVLDGDATIAIITVPLGLGCIFSKEMLIVDKYYWEHEDESEAGNGDI